jgi:hypothetical protein
MILKQALMKRLLISLLILILVPAESIHAQKNMLEQKGVVIGFDEGLQPVAEAAARLYPAIKADLEKVIGWKIDFKPVIVLIKDNKTFQEMAGNSMIVAYALPDKDLIVIDYSKMTTDPFTLEATVKHELCHLLLHAYVRAENLPRWLDEGVAQWVSGGLADIVIEKRSVLNEAVMQNRVLGLQYLNDGFPRDRDRLTLAYAESKSFVEYMTSGKGDQGLLELLGCLKAGDDLDSSIMKTFSISFNELEQRWYSSLQKKTLWVSLLINNLYEILFFLSALVLIYGFIRAWIRKRRYGEEEIDDL